MRVLLTGASGRVARHVIADLEVDHDLVLVARRRPEEWAHEARAAGQCMRADVTDLDACRRMVAGVDAVVHLGAIHYPTDDTFRNNALSTYNLAEAMREAGVKLMIFASSECALGQCFRTSGRPFEAQYFPFDEQHPSVIEDNYGLSKRTGELTLEAYTRSYGLTCYALRLGWCWDAEMIARHREQAIEPARYAGGFWGYVDMRDTVRAFRLALEQPLPAQPHFGCYFISSGDTLAEEDSAELVERFYPQYRHLAETMSGRQSFFNTAAARRDFGYVPQFSWRD